jgi:hypothetical protein
MLKKKNVLLYMGLLSVCNDFDVGVLVMLTPLPVANALTERNESSAGLHPDTLRPST